MKLSPFRNLIEVMQRFQNLPPKKILKMIAGTIWDCGYLQYCCRLMIFLLKNCLSTHTGKTNQFARLNDSYVSNV